MKILKTSKFGALEKTANWLKNPQNQQALRTLLDLADQSLPPEAQKAISAFVGHEPMSRDSGFGFGLMHQDRLEDAYSANPSPEGKIVRQQLTQAFNPVKMQIQRLIGNELPLVRYQRPVPEGAARRNVLSWSLNPEFVEDWAGIRNIKRYTNEDIDKAVNEFKSKGEVQWGRHIHRNEGEQGINMYSRGNNEHITGYGDAETLPEDSFRQHCLEDQLDRQQEYDHYEAKRSKTILQQTTPLDKIVWATDRANQMEFIVRNT